MNCNTTHYRANSSSVPGDPTKAVGGVELKDAKLVELRDKYAANLTKLAGNVRSLAKLYVGKASPEEAKKIEADAEKIEKDESKLVDEVNTYCSAH